MHMKIHSYPITIQFDLYKSHMILAFISLKFKFGCVKDIFILEGQYFMGAHWLQYGPLHV